jgi:DNA-binding response OmpR family regulator
MSDPLLFRDFVLRIGELVDDSYCAYLDDSPFGTAKLTLSTDALARLKDLDDALKAAYLSGDTNAIRALSEKLGANLFDTLVQGEIRRKYDKSLGYALKEDAVLRILLRVASREWADILLEVMRDRGESELGDQFLCRGRKTVLSRYPVTTMPDKPPIQPQSLTVLVVIASPVGPPRLAAKTERRELEKARRREAELAMRFLGLSRKIKPEYLEKATYTRLEAAMQLYHPHAVHFIGHARHTPDGPALVLEDDNEKDDLTSGERLMRLFRGPEETPRLVYLNACETSDICQQLISYYGISTVIGTRFRVHDRVAIEFTSRMYAALLGGSPIDYAVREAREGILSLRDCGYEWMAYMLAMHNKSGHVFQFAPAPEIAQLLEEIRTHIANLASTVKEVWEAAIEALVKFGEAVVGLLVEVVERREMLPRQREGAVEVLGEIMTVTGDDLPAETLSAVAKNPVESETIRERAAKALKRSQPARARRSLERSQTKLESSQNLATEDVYKPRLDNSTTTRKHHASLMKFGSRFNPIIFVDAQTDWLNFAVKVLEQYGIEAWGTSDISRVNRYIASRTTSKPYLVFVDRAFFEQEFDKLIGLARSKKRRIFVVALLYPHVALDNTMRICFKAGAYDCADKPYSKQSLLNLIQSYDNEINGTGSVVDVGSKSATVLLVDSNSEWLKSSVEALGEYGIKAWGTNDITKAWEMVERSPRPHLMLLEWALVKQTPDWLARVAEGRNRLVYTVAYSTGQLTPWDSFHVTWQADERVEKPRDVESLISLVKSATQKLTTRAKARD